MSLLTVKNLKLGYDGKTVVEGLNFTVNSGDYLCIVGVNGSGKTTLMKTILHLNSPLSGSVETGEGLKPSEIGYLPQQTEIQRDFPASVWEIVLSGNLAHGGLRPFYSKKEKAAARKSLEKMGISKLAPRCYRELSGGQQQRVAIGRALINNPALMLADEPTGNLDSENSKEIVSLLRQFNKELNQTVIIITHDEKIALSADRIISIEDGKITRDEVRNR